MGCTEGRHTYLDDLLLLRLYSHEIVSCQDVWLKTCQTTEGHKVGKRHQLETQSIGSDVAAAGSMHRSKADMGTDKQKNSRKTNEDHFSSNFSIKAGSRR